MLLRIKAGQMNAMDRFSEEYAAAVTSGAAVATSALSVACCKFVQQPKTDGFQLEHLIAYVNEQMAGAGERSLEQSICIAICASTALGSISSRR